MVVGWFGGGVGGLVVDSLAGTVVGRIGCGTVAGRIGCGTVAGRIGCGTVDVRIGCGLVYRQST